MPSCIHAEKKRTVLCASIDRIGTSSVQLKWENDLEIQGFERFSFEEKKKDKKQARLCHGPLSSEMRSQFQVSLLILFPQFPALTKTQTDIKVKDNTIDDSSRLYSAILLFFQKNSIDIGYQRAFLRINVCSCSIASKTLKRNCKSIRYQLKSRTKKNASIFSYLHFILHKSLDIFFRFEMLWMYRTHLMWKRWHKSISYLCREMYGLSQSIWWR